MLAWYRGRLKGAFGHVSEAQLVTNTGAGGCDDTPAGGGPGMVMRADVLAAALDAV